MNIRPHHILCVQNYVGYGYNEDFTSHMDRITKELVQNPQIIIQEGCDDICNACPHNIDNTCHSLDKVRRMDSLVNKACDIDYNEIYNWNDLEDRARKRIFDTKAFDDICNTCQWYDICKKKQDTDKTY